MGLLPLINTKNVFYLSNLEGSQDFEGYQKIFEYSFQYRNIKGYAGSNLGAKILWKGLGKG